MEVQYSAQNTTKYEFQSCSNATLFSGRTVQYSTNSYYCNLLQFIIETLIICFCDSEIHRSTSEIDIGRRVYGFLKYGGEEKYKFLKCGFFITTTRG